MVFFSPSELRLCHLDINHSGTITGKEILSKIPKLKSNPLVERIVNCFDKDRDGQVNLDEFIQGLSRFTSANEHTDTKLRFAFKIYDWDNDGFISYFDLVNVMKLLTGGSIKDRQIRDICQRTINYYDTSDNGKLNFEEFKALVVTQGLSLSVTAFE